MSATCAASFFAIAAKSSEVVGAGACVDSGAGICAGEGDAAGECEAQAATTTGVSKAILMVTSGLRNTHHRAAPHRPEDPRGIWSFRPMLGALARSTLGCVPIDLGPRVRWGLRAAGLV